MDNTSAAISIEVLVRLDGLFVITSPKPSVVVNDFSAPYAIPKLFSTYALT